MYKDYDIDKVLKTEPCKPYRLLEPIVYLLSEGILFICDDWREEPSVSGTVQGTPYIGLLCEGKILAINCNNVFFPRADAEEIGTEEEIEELIRCIKEVNNSYIGAILYVSRKRKCKPMDSFMEECVSDDLKPFFND